MTGVDEVSLFNDLAADELMTMSSFCPGVWPPSQFAETDHDVLVPPIHVANNCLGSRFSITNRWAANL